MVKKLDCHTYSGGSRPTGVLSKEIYLLNIFLVSQVQGQGFGLRIFSVKTPRPQIFSIKIPRPHTLSGSSKIVLSTKTS